MPIADYDRYFGGRRGSAAEAYAAMVKEYGASKGARIFYGTMNRNKRRLKGKR